MCRRHEYRRHPGTFAESYQKEESPTLISEVTDAVLEEVEAWQSRLPEPLYPILQLDAPDGKHTACW
jgi:transposase-like protein